MMKLEYKCLPSSSGNAHPLHAIALLCFKPALRLFAFVVLSMSAASFAWASATEQLRQFSQTVSAARAEFSQTVASRSGQGGRNSTGDFSFMRPGRFNWWIRKPFEQRIVADSNRLIIYDPDLAQVSIRPLTEALGATPASLLFGPQNLDTLFELRDEPAVQGVEWLSAVPKNRDSTFTKIRIGFSGKWPVQMELTDAMGQTTQLTFRNWKGAESVGADAFQFAIPAGADVIDATQPARRPPRAN